MRTIALMFRDAVALAIFLSPILLLAACATGPEPIHPNTWIAVKKVMEERR